MLAQARGPHTTHDPPIPKWDGATAAAGEEADRATAVAVAEGKAVVTNYTPNFFGASSACLFSLFFLGSCVSCVPVCRVFPSYLPPLYTMCAEINPQAR